MKRKGFTLVEVMVAAAVLAIGVVAALGALGTLTSVDGKSRDTDRMVRLANEKLQELRATGELDLAPQSGNYENTADSRFAWAVEVEPSEVENLEIVRVTVHPANQDESAGFTITTLRFVPPETGGTETP